MEDALNNGISSVDELVASFTETLVTRRVTEPIRLLMSELVTEVIRAWREEFCRTISLKLNAGFLLPFCEALPNYMRKEVGKHARSMGIDEHAPSEGGSGAAVSEGDGDGARVLSGLDARTAKLRQSIEERLEEKSMLQRIATRMRVGAPPRPMKEMGQDKKWGDEGSNGKWGEDKRERMAHVRVSNTWGGQQGAYLALSFCRRVLHPVYLSSVRG